MIGWSIWSPAIALRIGVRIVFYYKKQNTEALRTYFFWLEAKYSADIPSRAHNSLRIDLPVAL